MHFFHTLEKLEGQTRLPQKCIKNFYVIVSGKVSLIMISKTLIVLIGMHLTFNLYVITLIMYSRTTTWERASHSV